MSLVELLVALAITAILAGVAAPSFAAYLEKQRVETTASRFHAHMSLARNTAITRGTVTVMQANVEKNWSRGWHVYVDRNGNDVQDQDEMDIAVAEATPGNVTVSGNASVVSAIRFGADGRPHLDGGGFQAGTITIAAGCNFGTQLVMSRTGRVRHATGSSPPC
jgi:type IV fimbrial biogenesis protein FimT